MKILLYFSAILIVASGCRREYFHRRTNEFDHNKHISFKYYGKKQDFLSKMDQIDDYLNDNHNVFIMPLDHSWWNGTNRFVVWSYYTKNGNNYIAKSITCNDTVISAEKIKYPEDLKWLVTPVGNITWQYRAMLGTLYDKDIVSARLVNHLTGNDSTYYNPKVSGLTIDMNHVNPLYITLMGEDIDTISDNYTRELMKSIITYIRPEMNGVKKSLSLINDIQNKYRTPLFIAFDDWSKLDKIIVWCFFEEDNQPKLFIRKIDTNHGFTDHIIPYSGDLKWLSQNIYNFYTLGGADEDIWLTEDSVMYGKKYKDYLCDNPIYCRYNNLSLCDDVNGDWVMCRNEYSRKFGIHQNPIGVDSIVCDTINDYFMRNFYKAIRDYNIIPNVLK